MMRVDPSIESPGVFLSGFVQMFPKIPLILFICLQKLHLNQKIYCKIHIPIFRILQFSRFFFAFYSSCKIQKQIVFLPKYSIKCYAEYKFSKKMLRKVQEIMLRKIQISMKIVPQNTTKIFCIYIAQITT